LNRILSDNQEIINHKQLRFGPEWGDDSISVSSVVAKTKMRDDKAVENSFSDEREEVDEVEEVIEQLNVR
jgi:hypothetical protein